MRTQRRLWVEACSALLAAALGSCSLAPAADTAPATPEALVAKMRPVSAAMLQNPAPGDWLQRGRTYDGQNYSPLTRSPATM